MSTIKWTSVHRYHATRELENYKNSYLSLCTKLSQQHKPQCIPVRQACARKHPVVHDALRSGRRCYGRWGDAMAMRRCDGRWGDAMDDEAMRWCDAMGLCYHRPIASPHRPSHRLIVHRITSSSIASPHRPLHRPIASPHRPSHRLIVHRIAWSSIALDIIRNASVSLLGHHM